ncbi:MAG TPA: bifunctional nicotinamidase/pyrazinamidase [Thermoanaerobaculaceae bacterium]|nr:bifunctional nicotinamidase/pyrazinamidase [Thermoanaerobaculaceae bacterium]
MEGQALLVVDLQNDFCPGGALAVTDGDAVVPVVNALMPRFPLVVATQDWHPAGHASFASSHRGRKPLEVIDLDGIAQVLWPDHCVQGTAGADFHPELDRDFFRAIIRKGTNPRVDSYSAFRDNHREHATGLGSLLRELGVGHVVIVGLTTDYCAATSARDAIELGFKAEIWLPATRPVGAPPGHTERTLAEIRELGVILRDTIPT